jgi:hypothetical protein
VENLISKLRQAIDLLESVGEDKWVARLNAYIQRIVASDKSVMVELRNEFGGMGTFNDLYLTQLNGHNVSPDSENRVNSQLSTLRTCIFDTLRDDRVHD